MICLKICHNTVKHLMSVVLNFSGLMKTCEILRILSLAYVIYRAPDGTENLMKFVTFFILDFLFDFALCHILGSPHRGDSKVCQNVWFHGMFSNIS